VRAKSRVDVDQEDVELNLTPMLDVVFILLIFFIVTAVFVKESGIDVNKPVVEVQTQRNPSVLVAVSANDTVWIDNGEYNVANIRPVLEGLKNENPRLEIVLQGDATANIGTTLQVQKVIDGLAIPVYISTEQR